MKKKAKKEMKKVDACEKEIVSGGIEKKVSTFSTGGRREDI